ncbi:Ribosomal L29 family protein [Hibiscus syriacus]|uniref:Ribosomal L29 family protein n=1 Tax=Hibiscus syriacus TaxID=106335 RepID=A0A6A2YMD8_HIBSY|nr:Ribosomal L29 family protein [Hibiscus syriacus]
MDFFCSSQASTAICSSLDHRSMVHSGHRPIDRQRSKPYAPCSSEFPMFPRLPHREKSRKSSVKPSDVSRKSSADIHDLRSLPGSSRYLLSNTPFIDWLSDSDRVSPSVPGFQLSLQRKTMSEILQYRFRTKKVTVIGDETPSSVLASVSRDKNAQLWPSATPASPPSSPMAQPSLLIKNKKH